MLGGTATTSLVVVLTNIEVSHFFLLKIPREETPHVEVVWHYAIHISEYPLKLEEQLLPFVEFIHEILDCSQDH